MTNTALATKPAPDLNMVVYGNRKEVDAQQEMRILRQAFPKSLAGASDDALRALVIASWASKLNPFAGEIYLIPGVGIMTASKIKASDAVAQAAERGNTLTIDFARIPEGTSEWNTIAADKGLAPRDVVVRCEITSSKARADYFAARLARITELRANYGDTMTGAEREARVNEEFGAKAPTVKVYGIVKATENFGGAQAEGKFTREDRAQKRALQKALNLGGYAATDRRSYGGQTIVEERVDDESGVIEGQFKPVEPEGGVRGAVEFTPETESDVIEGQATQAPAEPVVEKPVDPPTEKAKGVRKDPPQDLKSESAFGAPEDAKTVALAAVPKILRHVDQKRASLTIAEWKRARSSLAAHAITLGVKPEAIPAESELMRDLEKAVDVIAAAIVEANKAPAAEA